MHSEARLQHKFHEFAKLMNTYLNHFPRHEKHGLALQIRSTAYDVYALVIEAQKRYHKKTTLTQLDVRHEQLRMLLKLAHELGYFGFSSGRRTVEAAAVGVRRYLVISRLVDELGRMIGGWISAERAKMNAREAP